MFPPTGKSAAPFSFIFKLWLDETESGIGEKKKTTTQPVYSGFSYFNRLPFVPASSISHISLLQYHPLATDRLVQPFPLF